MLDMLILKKYCIKNICPGDRYVKYINSVQKKKIPKSTISDMILVCHKKYSTPKCTSTLKNINVQRNCI